MSESLPIPVDDAGIDAEIGVLEGRMSDTRSWFGDREGQARHLALLEAKEASGRPVAYLPPTVSQHRLADIEVLMADTGSEYWQGPRSALLQAEYRSLISPPLDATAPSITVEAATAELTAAGWPIEIAAPAARVEAALPPDTAFDVMQSFSVLPEQTMGAVLRGLSGSGSFEDRVRGVVASLDDAGIAAFGHWFDALTDNEVAAIKGALA